MTIEPKSAAWLETIEWSDWTSASSKTAPYIQLPFAPDSMPMIAGDVNPSVMPKSRGARAAMSAIRIATLSLPAIILLLLEVAESSRLASAASMSGCQAGVRRGDVAGACEVRERKERTFESAVPPPTPFPHNARTDKSQEASSPAKTVSLETH